MARQSEFCIKLTIVERWRTGEINQTHAYHSRTTSGAVFAFSRVLLPCLCLSDSTKARRLPQPQFIILLLAVVAGEWLFETVQSVNSNRMGGHILSFQKGRGR